MKSVWLKVISRAFQQAKVSALCLYGQWTTHTLRMPHLTFQQAFTGGRFHQCLMVTKSVLGPFYLKERCPELKGYHCTKNCIYTNLLGANVVQKSANQEKIKGKDGKYCICILVYMGLQIRGQMRSSYINRSLHFFASYLQ